MGREKKKGKEQKGRKGQRNETVGLPVPQGFR